MGRSSGASEGRRPGGKDRALDAHGRAEIEKTPEGLIDTPLDFFFAEHYRQRQVAQLLFLIAEDVINLRTISSVVQFLECDLSDHVRDEEDCFFPMLRAVCKPEDELDTLLGRISQEHLDDRTQGESASKILAALLDGASLTEEGAVALRHLARHLKHHIALENGVLLPIARARLDAADLAKLAKELKARREGGRLHT